MGALLTRHLCLLTMAAFARHPRYTIALVFILFITILYFANVNFSDGQLFSDDYPLSKSKSKNRPPPPQALYTEDKIKLSETYYREHLKNRKGLINKYGPTVDKVDS